MQEQTRPASRISARKIINLLVLAAWIILVIPYIVRMIRAGETQSPVVVTSQFVEVQSAHGIRIPLHAITHMELKDEIPKIRRRVKGYNSLSCVKKGQFKLEGMGIGNIYIFTREGPYLVIFMGDQFVIIAFKDPDRTRHLYEQISTHMK